MPRPAQALRPLQSTEAAAPLERLLASMACGTKEDLGAGCLFLAPYSQSAPHEVAY